MITVFEMATGQEEVAATHEVEGRQSSYPMSTPPIQLRLLTLDEAMAAEQRSANPNYLLIQPMEH
ncbi:hypothetical protein ACUHMQ_15190 [Chitinimonas sp. PSY-7]|uniref:hypothetical protein n=1 Tax=Chitinimonas sp. PSY-7 TaxID=3459088 RepID=UPI00403FCA52